MGKLVTLRLRLLVFIFLVTSFLNAIAITTFICNVEDFFSKTDMRDFFYVFLHVRSLYGL